jgi:two-component system response regulator YesN
MLPKICQETGLSATAVLSRYYYSFTSLAKAYNEAELSLLSVPFVCRPLFVSAGTHDKAENYNRITLEMEKRLAQAVPGHRALFEDILFREAGLKDVPAECWLYGEIRQTAMTAAWILRIGERDVSKLRVLDSLAEILLQAVDSFDREEMLDILDQMIQERFPPLGHQQQSKSMERIARQAQEYIDANYSEPLSLSTLSELFYIDNSSLSRAFKKSTGVNLTFYITQKRVEQAKKYLISGKLNIKEVSQLTGYEDYAYFSRIFKKMTGVSPKQYSEGKRGGYGGL